MSKEIEKQLLNLQDRFEKLDTKLSRLAIEKNTFKKQFDSYINRQFTEIKVVEKGENGKWGDYSGVFYITPKEERAFLINKAKKHFNKYFKEHINPDKWNVELNSILSAINDELKLINP